MRGTVEKYGSTWRIRYEAGLKANGERQQRSRGGFATKKAAEEALRIALEQVRTGLAGRNEKQTVAEYLDVWLDGKHKLRPSTRRAYESHIRTYFKPLIGQIKLSALRADHLDVMYDAIRAGKIREAPGAATVRRIHATLHSAMTTAYKRRLIAYNPAGQVELESSQQHVRDIWSPSQLDTFLDFAGPDRLGAGYHLIAMTGLRRGEMCGLRWVDLDLDAGLVTVRQQHVEVGSAISVGDPKTKRGARSFPLDAATVAVLRSHKAAQAVERLGWESVYVDHGLVFCKEDGKPLRPEYVTRHFLELARRAGLPRIVLHGLRHTHASHALAAGVDVVVVSRRLGHSSTSLTRDTYQHVMPEQAREAAELVASLYRRTPPAKASGEAP